jgi:hypothetical protein
MLSLAVQILRTLNPTLSSRMQEILGCSLRLPKSIAGCGLYATCRILQADCTEHLGRKAKVKNPE